MLQITIVRVISIHAPTRGATDGYEERTQRIMDFNPRSHKGSDTARSSGDIFLNYFNPRSHKGSDS